MPDFVMRRWDPSILVTMTPQIDALVRELHEVPPEQQPLVWARHDSSPVPGR